VSAFTNAMAPERPLWLNRHAGPPGHANGPDSDQAPRGVFCRARVSTYNRRLCKDGCLV